MGYNRADFVRIKAEYLEKYLKARSDADLRAQEVYLIIYFRERHLR